MRIGEVLNDAAVITGIMDVAFTTFAVYGIFVFRKWHKVADKTESMLDEMHESWRDEKNGESNA